MKRFWTKPLAVGLLCLIGLSSVVDAAVIARVTRHEYNSLSQKVKTYATDPATGTEVLVKTYTYDPNGLLDQEIDVNGKVTDYKFDGLNRFKRIIPDNGALLPTGNSTGYALTMLDVFDRPLRIRDLNGMITFFTYDTLGNLWKLDSPDTGTTTWLSYDDAGNPTAWKDALQNTIRVSYDALNRPIRKSVDIFGGLADQQPITYVWDGTATTKGRLSYVSATTDNGKVFNIGYSYDLAGNVLSRNDFKGSVLSGAGKQAGRTIAYGKDTAYRTTSINYPSNRAISYGYNAYGEISQINRHAQGTLLNPEKITTVSWHPFGALKSLAWVNGLTFNDSYDKNGRLDKKGFGSGVKDYDWYLDGTLKTIIDPVATRTQSFDRNLTGKLTNWSQNTQTRSWSYDFGGNRKTQVIGTSTETYDYPKEALGQAYSGNRLKAISGATSKTFVYNAAGNITSDGVYTYGYDGHGRLVSLQQNGVEKAHYDYNGFNQRVNKVVGGIATQYSYDENAQLLGEYDASEKALQETVWLGNRPILARRTVGTVLKDDIIAADHLNTPRELIDWTSKKVVWRWDGEPYGSTLASDDPDVDGTKVSYNLRFPGQVFDAESGLHYNQNRTYNPATGRYIQADPTGLDGGLNLYTYAEANPTLYVDPLGLMANKCYENPGHHDPSGNGPNSYNPSKSVLPKDHEALWKQSKPASDGNQWTKVGSGKKAEYHRFQNDGNGNFHWNGSSNGVTAGGQTRAISINNIPVEVKRW